MDNGDHFKSHEEPSTEHQGDRTTNKWTETDRVRVRERVGETEGTDKGRGTALFKCSDKCRKNRSN